MIDTHCHIDLYNNPIEIANECEKLGIITIGMTNLPSHFELGYKHLRTYQKVRLALGLHPLYSELHAIELPGFIRNIPKTSYIGEIGLDFSKQGIASKEIQIDSFKKILAALKDKQKILSLHSRKAEKEVLQFLIAYDIKLAIFHWYSGPLSLIPKIVDSGFYLSVNTAMIKSKSGQAIIQRLPSNCILTESDGPFIENKGNPVKPSDLGSITSFLAKLWNKSENDVQKLIDSNFKRLISSLSKVV